jgi:hypothetical protein
MKPNELVESDTIRKNFGSGQRITKQLSAMRRRDPDSYPAGTRALEGNEVTALEAARLILILTKNPNPFSGEFDRAFNSIEILSYFLKDLSQIFAEDGFSLHGKVVESVFISLDRPFGKISFVDQMEAVYGDCEARGAERFSSIPAYVLQELAELLKGTSRIGTASERQDLLKNLKNEKI